jgi:hypothetical protein
MIRFGGLMGGQRGLAWPAVLSGLAEVGWGELEHAYGAAGDVPELLRRVGGADQDDAVQALEELRGSILHQGSVCSATAPAVPFLGKLLAEPGTVCRAGIAHLLGDMAAIRDPGDPVLQELRAAVTADADRLLPLLGDDEPGTRLLAAYALAQCPGRAADILTAFRERWVVEADPRVRANLVIAEATLDPHTGLLTEALADHQPAAVRAGAALAAARTPVRWPGEPVVDAVRAGWAGGDPWSASDDVGVPYPWNWDPIDDLLDPLGPADGLAVVAALLASTDPEVRTMAAGRGGWLAWRFRSARRPAAALLATALTDAALQVRSAAVQGIRQAGRAAIVTDVADALVTLVEHDDAAAGAGLCALIEIGDPRWRDHLPTRLAVGAAAPETGTVLAAVGTPADPDLRDAVRRRLTVMPADTPFDIEAHIARLRAGERPELPVYHADEQLALVRLLASWGPAAAPVVPELTALLEAGQSVATVAEALAAIGPAAEPAIPVLRRLAAKGDGPNRLAAAGAIWRLTGDPQPALDAAAHEIETGGWTSEAVALLADLGAPARRLLPRLQTALAQRLPTSLPGQCGQLALARLVRDWTGDPGAVLPAVRVVLQQGWPEARAAAADLAIGLGDPTAVDVLHAKLADPDVNVGTRLDAARALWRHTGEADPLVGPVVAIATGRPEHHYLCDALDLLAALGPAARSALPALRRLATQDETIAAYTADDHSTLDESARVVLDTTIGAIEA